MVAIPICFGYRGPLYGGHLLVLSFHHKICYNLRANHKFVHMRGSVAVDDLQQPQAASDSARSWCDSAGAVCMHHATGRRLVDGLLQMLLWPGWIERQMVFLHELKGRQTCSGLRPNVNARVVSAQQVLDEGSFPCAVLSQQQNRGLGLEVRLCQKGRKKAAKLVRLL